MIYNRNDEAQVFKLQYPSRTSAWRARACAHAHDISYFSVASSSIAMRESVQSALKEAVYLNNSPSAARKQLPHYLTI